MNRQLPGVSAAFRQPQMPRLVGVLADELVCPFGLTRERARELPERALVQHGGLRQRFAQVWRCQELVLRVWSICSATRSFSSAIPAAARTKPSIWVGHGGRASEETALAQVDPLVADLAELRDLLGNVWSRLRLIRADSARRRKDAILQQAEVVVGSRSPFATEEFRVGEMMEEGELYLLTDGAQTPLRLAHFVQLRAASESAQYTSYFYNRTEGSSIRMVSYQYGPDDELLDGIDTFHDEFGALIPE